jgi:acyl-CoA reductase-like NAD-dependent aldehyde dehydrogenase
MDLFSDYSMTIGGQAVVTARSHHVVNPATAEPFAAAPVAEAAHLNSAVAAARSAFPSWRALGIEKRRALLIDLARAIESRVEAFGALFLREHGRPAEGSTGPHIPFAGFKQSGVGVENGQAGLLEFTQSKTIYIPKKVAQAET